jgi:folate-binding protein YgfZ
MSDSNNVTADSAVADADELSALRTGAAVADRAAAGRLAISGPDALDLLNRLSTNQLDVLPDGESRWTVLTNGDARVIDLLALGALDGTFLCLTSPGRADAVIEWLDMYTFAEEIEVVDRTPSTFQLTLAGPESESILRGVTGLAGEFSLDSLRLTAIAGVEVTVWRILGSGRDGFEIIGGQPDVEAVRDALVTAGGVPVSSASWEAYRVENGMPAYGAEFGPFNNPLESRLRGAMSEIKGCYTGQEVIARLETYRKVQRRLMSLALSGGATPGAKLTSEGASAGVVTSVAATPEGFAALALVSSKHAEAGGTLDVAADDGATGVTALLVEPAFAIATEPNQDE